MKMKVIGEYCKDVSDVRILLLDYVVQNIYKISGSKMKSLKITEATRFSLLVLGLLVSVCFS